MTRIRAVVVKICGRWACRRGRHEWESFGYFVITHPTGPADDDGDATLTVGDHADVWPIEDCARCGARSPSSPVPLPDTGLWGAE